MSSNTINKGRDKAFIELGKFLALFEHITYYFKDCIGEILKYNGLNNSEYSDILLSKLTAEPIKTIFQGMVPYHFNENQVINVNKILSEYSNLIEIRNIIIHCYWAIGVSPDNHLDVSLYGIKSKASKKGISLYNLNLGLNDLKDINRKVIQFSELIWSLKESIEKGENEVSNFSLDKLLQIQLKSIINRLKETI